MNFLSLLFCVSYLTFASSAPTNEKGIFDIDESDISYYFYTINTQETPIKIENNNVEVLNATSFDPSKLTVFVVHGLLDILNPVLNSLVINNIFKHNDVNLFLIDWSNAGAFDQTGKIIGKFISDIQESNGIDGSSFVLVGFGVGGQLAGAIGQSVTNQIGHIIALDPLGISYGAFHQEQDEHLDPSDATLVEVIHTNGARYGKAAAIGHIDYFPNGGLVQPACKEGINALTFHVCSHYRACHYFGKVLNEGTGIYKAQLCPNWDMYSRGECANNEEREMGNLLAVNGTYGSYYLNIDDKEFDFSGF